MPEYMIKREDIMVMFKSLVSSLVNHTNQATDQTIPNEDNSIATRILKVIETEPMLSQKKSPILSERNIVRISSSFRTKVILILTHILRQRLLRRQASLPGVLLGDQLERLKHRAVKIVQMQRHVAGVTRPRGLGSDLSHNRPPVQMAARAARGARAGA